MERLVGRTFGRVRMFRFRIIAYAFFVVFFVIGYLSPYMYDCLIFRFVRGNNIVKFFVNVMLLQIGL